jgi:ribulose-5-phosphate 4-epimerase/fuculose-1-phosphate aldolase
MMGNHGVLVVVATIPEAFEDLYFIERACQTMVLAYSTGQELKVMIWSKRSPRRSVGIAIFGSSYRG